MGIKKVLYTIIYNTVEPLNNGHFGTGINLLL